MRKSRYNSRYIHVCISIFLFSDDGEIHHIEIRRIKGEVFGFVIRGGADNNSSPSIKNIVNGTPAYRDGRLRVRTKREREEGKEREDVSIIIILKSVYVGPYQSIISG